MLQAYTFTGEASTMTLASKEARTKLNRFLAMDVETNLIDITQIFQSESQSVSVWEGVNDWSYSFTITVFMNVVAGDVEKISQMYRAAL